MRGRYFEELDVGTRWVTSGRTLTQSDILNFAGFNGDFNPLHVDEEFAKTTMYGGVVASAPLVFAMMSGMFSQLGHLDGTGRGWLDLTWLKVHHYVHPGETLHLEVEIVSKEDGPRPGVGTITWHEVMINQRGEKIIEQERRTMVARRGADV